MPVIERVLGEWPEIKAPRLTELLRDEHGYGARSIWSAGGLRVCARGRSAPAQRTGYRPGQVVQFDWGEMPTRPRIGGVQRRVYALVASLPFSGAQTAHFSFDMTSSRSWRAMSGCLTGSVGSRASASMTTCGPRSPSATAVRWSAGTSGSCICAAITRFTRTACTPATPREKGSVEGAVRYLKTGFWPARRFGRWLSLIGCMAIGVTGSRISAGMRRGSSSSRTSSSRIAPGCGRCRRAAFDFSLCRSVRVPPDGYLRHGACFYRAPVELVHQRVELHASRDAVWICWRGQQVAATRGPIAPACWIPEPRMRPEPPPLSGAVAIAVSRIDVPELADYAQLCA